MPVFDKQWVIRVALHLILKASVLSGGSGASFL